jgi:hypothetical protein
MRPFNASRTSAASDPCSIASHGVTFVPSQFVHAVDVVLNLVHGPQDLHVALAVPEESWNLPSPHIAHTVDVVSNSVPGPQNLHVALAAPEASWNLPVGHAEHFSVGAVISSVPAAQRTRWDLVEVPVTLIMRVSVTLIMRVSVTLVEVPVAAVVAPLAVVEMVGKVEVVGLVV